MKRLSELSFEEIGALPAGKVTDAMVARECLSLKVTEIRSGVCDVDAKYPGMRIGKGTLDYAIHRPHYPDTVFDYESIEPYSTTVRAAAEIMWIYGIMVHSIPISDAANGHGYVYRAFIPDHFDQREEPQKAHIAISASLWIDADTWPLAVVRAALMQEKSRGEKEREG